LFGEPPDELTKSLIWLLLAASEVPGITRVHVCAPEIPNEDPYQIGPVTDLARGQVLQPSSRRVGQEQGEVVDDE
jgi:hypothetical protein